ncbi:hypothetical protein CSB45_12195 [candidate division KSB3 bacterium]|uniref:GDYXXLXY domain-containing protein n=1 Tax=candidate division KSB3 bacterium TaxID=2044937 RepID=A0A2G6E2J3_9BACT|nr:MAG: hypothetical protein CSB45_12195 [candidate division KSB3 bacterium]PIE28857.1 MAG: hypothetical protein CSA57_11870 [candidate division KSB3 bacterium]
MKKFPTLPFLLVVLCQFLVLGGMIAKRVHLLNTGKIVRLQCQPVDPRSLLSGDYVVLNYTISRFSEKQLRQLNHDHENLKMMLHGEIYVALSPVPDAQYWEAVAVSQHRQTLQAAYPVVIRGIIRPNRRPYQIRYGVEHYFVPQFEGRQIEQEISNVTVEVAVAESGESAIKRLFINDQEVEFY